MKKQLKMFFLLWEVKYMIKGVSLFCLTLFSLTIKYNNNNTYRNKYSYNTYKH